MSSRDIAVLIIAYKRHEYLSELLLAVASFGVKKIYVAIDGARTAADINDVNRCKEIVLHFKSVSSVEIEYRFNEGNLGCALAVFEACSWIFDNERFAAILEDDCVPSEDFFNMLIDSRPILEHSGEVLLACGSQFVPSSITKDSWYLSKFPLIWGWGTTQSKWAKVATFLKTSNIQKSTTSEWRKKDFSFWSAGARRSYQGFVDAWDLPLSFNMQNNHLLAIHAGQNLVMNIGDDLAATHTKGFSPWIKNRTSEYKASESLPIRNTLCDEWLEKNLFRISYRHIVSTKITYILDFLKPSRRKRPPIEARFNF